MTKMILRRTATITETRYVGWQIVWSDGAEAFTETAAEALRTVKLRDTSDVEDGGADGCITVVEWNTRSRVGGIVVKVLAGVA